ncbi:glycoprotein [Lyssavirus shimoni]|uniref:Glycoprotein n=1 Tax=Lyssavirus shimoni TaxID=746543 RepID=D4NRK1_9RHAB|nr:glycoprotein [Lyssavirus shimoni]ADD84510.1 glycoprotein [Lyssavirus shimoni]
MSNLCTIFILCASIMVSLGDFPLYTIPEKIGPWTPIDLTHLSCPNNLLSEDDGCSSSSTFSYIELRTGYLTHQKVSGFTCTGVINEAVTYTNFVGYVTTTFKRKHFKPTASACRDAYHWKISGDPRYEESLHTPYPDNSWLRTVTTTKESLLIISPSIVEMDIYSRSLHSPMFPTGRCYDFYKSTPSCLTNHDYTIWLPDDANVRLTCDIFVTSTGKKSMNGSKMCGFTDERGLYRTLKGACKLTLCGKPGLRLFDGTWISITRPEIVMWCSPNQLVNVHNNRVDEIEHLIVGDLIRRREECLDTLETVLMSKSVSFRRLSHFRKLVPGFGKAYTIANGSLMETNVHYKRVDRWEEILPSKGCLKLNDKCLNPENGVFFNGIIKGPDGQVLIPEMQSSLLKQHMDLLKASVFPLRHPLIDQTSIFKKDGEADDFVDVHMPDPHKSISNIDLGLPDWGLYAMIGGTVVAFLILVCLLCTCCKRRRRRNSRKPSSEQTPKISSTPPSGTKVISSWESYKGTSSV